MTEELGPSDPPRRQVILEVAQATSLLIGICYATGWAFFTALFLRLGVQAEDAGVDAEYLIIRTAFVTGVLLVAVGGLLMPTAAGDWLERGRAGDTRPFMTLFVIAQVIFVLLAAVSLWVLGRVAFNDLNRAVLAVLVLAVAAVLLFLEGAAVIKGVGFRRQGGGPVLVPEWQPRLIMASVLIWLLVGLTLAVAGGLRLAGRVQDGEAVVNPLVNIRRVDTDILIDPDEVEAISEISNESCLMRLGESDGYVLLYAPGPHPNVVRVPTDLSVVVQAAARNCPVEASDG